MSPPLLNLRSFLSRLREKGEVVDIYEEVDPYLEIAEIHRRVAAIAGPALFFHRVKNSAFPVVTNLFGSKKRIDVAFENRPEEILGEVVKLLTTEFPPKLKDLWKKRDLIKSLLKLGTKRRRKVPVSEVISSNPNLESLPLLQLWPQDGGHFITLPLVYTEHPDGRGVNLGMYRIQRYDKKTAGLHFQIAKGGGFHYHLAEKRNQSLPVSIFIGGAPALILSAITPLPENVSELLVAALLQGEKVGMGKYQEYSLLAECEFALLGSAPPKIRHAEGPFGDHYGYYSLIHDYPLFNCHKLLHRKNAIYPATVVGKPKQEDFYIGEYLQKLLSPLFPLVIPGVKSIWSYGEAGFHSISAAIVKERYYRECMTSAFRILGEGQLSLTKFLFLTDQNVPLQNFKHTLATILERFDPVTDLFIFSNLSLDTLDYTGPALNQGSRGVFLGIGEKKRELPQEFKGTLPSPLSKAALFCRGCLVIEGPKYESFTNFDLITGHVDFALFPLIILVDHLKKTLRDETSFLWTVFTRFEPAADIHAQKQEIIRHHICYKGPLLIDARMKPSYPSEVLCDEKTSELVTKKWNLYFPQGMEIGSSDTAHVH
ncbi:MAG: UbiD family decarboxylase [Chlamydiia bacterium]|nr:UbiD family decarboxylase [Chlamydiia bacterium]